MTLFDLIFALVFLVTLGGLLLAGVAALRRRWGRSARILRTLGAFVAGYLAVVVGVSLLGRPRVIALEQPRCFDDWCIAVQRVRRTPEGAVVAYTVDLRLSSRARRRPQRENGVRIFVRDAQGRTYEPLIDAGSVPLNSLLRPGESVTATREFHLPADATAPALLIGHGWFPGMFIIGDDESLLHGRTRVPLE